MNKINLHSAFNRALKYIILSFVTMLLLRYYPALMMPEKEIILISCSVSITYAILDRIYPSINN